MNSGYRKAWFAWFTLSWSHTAVECSGAPLDLQHCEWEENRLWETRSGFLTDFLEYRVKISLIRLPVCLCGTALQDGRESMNLLSSAMNNSCSSFFFFVWTEYFHYFCCYAASKNPILLLVFVGALKQDNVKAGQYSFEVGSMCKTQSTTDLRLSHP